MPLWFRWLSFWILVALALTAYVLIGLLERVPDGAAIGALLQNPSFLAALVAALVALILVVANRYADMGHAEHERRSRETKASIALATEIRTNLERQRLSFSQEERSRTIDELVGECAEMGEATTRRDAAPPATTDKVATVDQTNFVYESLKKEVLNLPVEIIAPVVEYYNLDDMLNRTLETNSTVHALEPARKLKFFTEVYKLANESDAAAVRALTAIWFSLPMEARTTIDRPTTAAGPTIALADRLAAVAWCPFPSDTEQRQLAAVRLEPARSPSVHRNDGAAHGNPPAKEEPAMGAFVEQP